MVLALGRAPADRYVGPPACRAATAAGPLHHGLEPAAADWIESRAQMKGIGSSLFIAADCWPLGCARLPGVTYARLFVLPLRTITEECGARAPQATPNRPWFGHR